MRRYIRHSTDLPVDISLSHVVPRGREYLRNISRGGLRFRSTIALEPGRGIRVGIPVSQPVFETQGVVAWCQPANDGKPGFEVGVHFDDLHPVIGDGLMDRICHIEQYKHEVWLRDGRWLTGEEAALEWLQQQAEQALPAEPRGPGSGAPCPKA